MYENVQTLDSNSCVLQSIHMRISLVMGAIKGLLCLAVHLIEITLHAHISSLLAPDTSTPAAAAVAMCHKNNIVILPPADSWWWHERAILSTHVNTHIEMRCVHSGVDTLPQTAEFCWRAQTPI